MMILLPFMERLEGRKFKKMKKGISLKIFIAREEARRNRNHKLN
jgi:hypothetical protein